MSANVGRSFYCGRSPNPTAEIWRPRRHRPGRRGRGAPARACSRAARAPTSERRPTRATASRSPRSSLTCWRASRRRWRRRCARTAEIPQIPGRDRNRDHEPLIVVPVIAAEQIPNARARTVPQSQAPNARAALGMRPPSWPTGMQPRPARERRYPLGALFHHDTGLPSNRCRSADRTSRWQGRRALVPSVERGARRKHIPVLR